ncbi:hypothetical protein Tco_0966203 [Tanacetum coccineum]
MSRSSNEFMPFYPFIAGFLDRLLAMTEERPQRTSLGSYKSIPDSILCMGLLMLLKLPVCSQLLSSPRRVCYDRPERFRQECSSKNYTTPTTSIQQTRPRSRVILTLSAPHVDVDTQESVVVLRVLVSSAVRLVIFSETARRTRRVVVGLCDKKPDASGRVFAQTQGQGCNATGYNSGQLFPNFKNGLSRALRGIPPIRDCEFNIELFQEQKANLRLLTAGSIELKELRISSKSCWARVSYRKCIAWACTSFVRQERDGA